MSVGSLFGRRLALLILLCCACARAEISIKIVGDTAIGSGKLLDVIPPDPDEWNADALRAWREDAEFALEDYYRDNGYFEIHAHAETNKRGDKPKDWDAVITVTEGPRYRFDTVRVVGADLRPPGESDSGMALSARADTARVSAAPPPGPTIDTSALDARRGRYYQADLLLKDRRALLRRFGDAGYVRAEVDDRIDVRAKSKTVAVDYLVDPDHPVVFDTLVLRNMRAPPMDSLEGLTHDALLHSLIPYQRGDTVRMSSNDKVIEKLQYTGAFNYVRLKDSVTSDSTGRSTLYLLTEEHVPGNFRSSVFYETQYGPGVSLDARHSNVAGTLNEVRAGTSLAVDRQNFYLGYGSPLPFGLLLRFDDDISATWYQDQTVPTTAGYFAGDFIGLNSARLTWPHSYWLRLVSDMELEADSRILSLTERERDLTLNFIQSAIATFVDQPMDPTRGLRFTLTWGNGGDLFKNGLFRFAEYRHNWLELQTAQYYYFPPLRQVKFATRLDGGRFFGEGGANSKRFFLGGSRSVRSWDFQDLCPERTDLGVCDGENEALSYVQTSLELRVEPFAFRYTEPRGAFHFLVPLQVVPFVDFGKVWDEALPFHWLTASGALPPGEGYATGVGLRYPLFGIFNLRVDFPYGNGPVRLNIDLAQAF